MKVRWKIKQSVFLLISSVFLTLTCFSLSSAEVDFSPDIPVTLGGTTFNERDIVSYDSLDYSLQVDGEALGLPKGVEISAYTPYLEDTIVFAVDAPVTLDGVDYNCQALIMTNGVTIASGGSVSILGAPPGACIDALYIDEEYLYFSLDVPASLTDVDDLQPHDVYVSTLTLTDMYKAFDGSDHGIPNGVDLDGIDLSKAGHMKMSFDIPTEFASLEITERDICDYDESLSSWSIYFDGDSTGLPPGMNVDAVATSDRECIVSCAEDESGSLNIVETSGTSESEVTVTVEINNAPNEISSLKFDVTYNQDNCLTYTGNYEIGELGSSFDSFQCTLLEPGLLRCGGFTVEHIEQGFSGSLVMLTFNMDTPDLDDPSQAVKLGLRNLMDSINGWSKSPGYICGGCDCEGNFDDDEDVDGSDAFDFKGDFGRSQIQNPCESGNPCNGDFDCDNDVDGSDAFTFKEDFGRSPLGNPCPVCTRDPWCVYP